jgi:predicted small secreted protein
MMMTKRRIRMGARVLFAGVVLTGLAAVAPGCNTVKGFGQDVTSAAEATEEAFSEDPATQDPAQQRASTTEPYPKSKY